ncbi:Rossmann-like and DUF2520 domain-containing protein [Rufibacter sediminis]|uniref:DUF2520 domain-containing protein n=1 Tax=Rufibacter sediminis TaxID=2762756 RepID=A0ABR6VXY9_9BACT|nr:Rossmann-like and DUF2520 domain-containing protein [Rufibacter sediminis]MBC3541815.1 DUF2520 domain-containing protein [Rufibacter sediminis]
MNIGIVGAGNVATHLVKGLVKAGVNVPFVYSRTLASAQVLTAHLPSGTATSSPDLRSLPYCDVYLLSVPDQVLPTLLPQLRFPEGAIVAHTSGTQPLELLASLPNVATGVFYPLQTFSKEKELDWRRVPICVEASTQKAEEALTQLGQKISEQVVLMQGTDRRQLHVAAVFACNFTNHLWGVAQEVLKTADLPFNLLEPLVQETVQKAFQFPPFAVQTGPAVRGDASTIQAHLQLLQHQPQYRALYQTLTESIQTVHEKPPFSEKQA